MKARISGEIQFLIASLSAQQEFRHNKQFLHDDDFQFFITRRAISEFQEVLDRTTTRIVTTVSGLGVSCCTSFGCFDTAAIHRMKKNMPQSELKRVKNT